MSKTDKKDGQQRSFLFISKELNLGGVETLLVRVINWLTTHNQKVTLLLYRGSGKLKLVENLQENENLEIIKGTQKTRLKTSHFYIDAKTHKLLKNRIFDVIFTAMPKPFVVSYLFNGKKRFNGVYSNRAYVRNKTVKDILQKLDPLFTQKLLFMNENLKVWAEDALNTGLPDSYFPLPVRLPALKFFCASPQSGKIVSIGRLIPGKYYNYFMVPVMEQLIEKHPNLTWHIYGHGTEEERLKDLISKSKAKDHIFFHGAVNYEDIPNVLNNALCFVGQGTALLEACALGLPGIPALGKEKTAYTHGYYYHLPAFNTGADLEKKPTQKISDLISALAEIDEDEYASIAEKCRAKAADHDMDTVMQNFLQLTDNEKQEHMEPVNRKVMQMYNMYYLNSLLKGMVKRYIKRFDEISLFKGSIK